MEFLLTYIKGLVLFAVEGEGHGEGDLLRCPIIEFGGLMVMLVRTVGVEEGYCRKAEVEVLGDPPNPPILMHFGVKPTGFGIPDFKWGLFALGYLKTGLTPLGCPTVGVKLGLKGIAPWELHGLYADLGTNSAKIEHLISIYPQSSWEEALLPSRFPN